MRGAQAGTVEWRATWARYGSLAERRGRTNDAITALERRGELPAHIARFLRHLLDHSNERGGTRIGAVSLGAAMQRCKKTVLRLQAEACEGGWIQRIFQGGGRHRTNRFLLKIGVWRDDPSDAHQQNHFSERFKAENAEGDAELLRIFWEHKERGYCREGEMQGTGRHCWIFAPRELRQPQLPWEAGP